MALPSQSLPVATSCITLLPTHQLIAKRTEILPFITSNAVRIRLQSVRSPNMLSKQPISVSGEIASTRRSSPHLGLVCKQTDCRAAICMEKSHVQKSVAHLLRGTTFQTVQQPRISSFGIAGGKNSRIPHPTDPIKLPIDPNRSNRTVRNGLFTNWPANQQPGRAKLISLGSFTPAQSGRLPC